MFIKKIQLVALFTVLSFVAAAQQDEHAKKILDELSAKTKSYSTIKAEFSWTVEKKDKSKTSQEGKIQTKGNKYKLEIPGHEIYCDGKTVWDFIKDANEVQIKEVETESEDAITPTTIFTLYEKGFKYKFDSEDATKQIIDLYPVNPDKQKFHTVKLTIDKNKKQIVGVKMMMKDGSVQVYTVKSFTGNSAMPDSNFVFEPKAHAGVSVEDLR